MGLFSFCSLFHGVNRLLHMKKIPTEHKSRSRRVMAKQIYVLRELEPMRRVRTFSTDYFRLEFEDWESFYLSSITPYKLFNRFLRIKLGILYFSLLKTSLLTSRCSKGSNPTEDNSSAHIP